MDETVLGKVIRLHVIRRQLPQEIPDLGLVATNQLAKRCCVLYGDNASDEEVILFADYVDGLADQSRSAKRQMIR